MPIRAYPGSRLHRVIDGDTFVVMIDQGFYNFTRQRIRLAGVNAIEVKDPGGPEAAANLHGLLGGIEFDLNSYRTASSDNPWPENLGRYVASVILPDGFDLAEMLVDTGWAARWDGHGAKPVPPWPRL